MFALIVFALFCNSFTSAQLKLQTQRPNPAAAAPTAKFDRKLLEKDLFKIDKVNDLNKLGINFVPAMPQSLRISGRKSYSLNSQDVQDAIPGKCDPKPVCIANPLTTTITASNQLVYPPCINIHRCDGCCPQNEKCVAVKSVDVRLKNVGIINITDSEIRYEDNIVVVQNHTDCECRCQWETDEECKTINANYVRDEYSCGCVCPSSLPCNGFQDFDEKLCQCICKPRYLQIKTLCKAKNQKWNENACKCEAVKQGY